MIKIPEPKFGSALTDLIVELEGLRNKRVSGTAKSWVFFELKGLFHIVEALSSTRIEGNHTTLSAFIDAQLDERDASSEELKEIANVITALNFIDANIADKPIDKKFILQLHKIVVADLNAHKEGDNRPGAYRNEPRKIANSKLVLPQHSDVGDLMDELIEFIGAERGPKNDLLKVAIAHHRFVWIHPFGNGNGRVVRLLTYAMLCKLGFIRPGLARLFNPTAVFSGNRQKYYNMLAEADKGGDDNILAWSRYVLSGLKEEVEKSQKLTDATFVRSSILMPAVTGAETKGALSELESKVLQRVVKMDSIKAGDIRDLWPKELSHVVVSKFLRKLQGQKFIMPMKTGGREYILRFTGNKLTRGILEEMERQGMLPMSVDELEEKGK